MNIIDRRKFRPQCRFDNLESRELLNGHFARPQIAHADQYAPRVPRVITGTLTGVIYSTVNISSPTTATGTDTSSLSGRTSAGQVGLSGTDQFTGTLVNPNVAWVQLYAGDWTMTMNNGSAIKIVYSGSGKYSQTGTGPWHQKLTGTAIGISGAVIGKKFLFVGTGQGTEATPDVTFRIRLSS